MRQARPESVRKGAIRIAPPGPLGLRVTRIATRTVGASAVAGAGIGTVLATIVRHSRVSRAPSRVSLRARATTARVTAERRVSPVKAARHVNRASRGSLAKAAPRVNRARRVNRTRRVRRARRPRAEPNGAPISLAMRIAAVVAATVVVVAVAVAVRPESADRMMRTRRRARRARAANPTATGAASRVPRALLGERTRGPRVRPVREAAIRPRVRAVQVTAPTVTGIVVAAAGVGVGVRAVRAALPAEVVKVAAPTGAAGTRAAAAARRLRADPAASSRARS